VKGWRTFYFNYTGYWKYQPQKEYWQKLSRPSKTVAKILGTPQAPSDTAFQPNPNEKRLVINVFNVHWVSNSQLAHASLLTSFSMLGDL